MAPSILNPWYLFNEIGASHGSKATVDFRSGERILRAAIPSDQLWVAIKDVLVYEDYEFPERFRLSQLRSGATVLDVGAFVGLYSLRASQYAERVVSLEPSAKNHQVLASNVELNNLHNVEPRQVALSSSTGFFRFSEAGTISELKKDGRHLVKTTTLDEVVKDLGQVDMLKMDIEGAEYEVFGASTSALKRISKIAAEIHIYNDGHRLGLKNLVAKLAHTGFKVDIVWSPFQSIPYGISKPWRCSLVRYNGGDAALYRLLLSIMYGIGPFARILKRTTEIGSEGLLYAYRQ